MTTKIYHQGDTESFTQYWLRKDGTCFAKSHTSASTEVKLYLTGPYESSSETYDIPWPYIVEYSGNVIWVEYYPPIYWDKLEDVEPIYKLRLQIMKEIPSCDMHLSFFLWKEEKKQMLNDAISSRFNSGNPKQDDKDLANALAAL